MSAHILRHCWVTVLLYLLLVLHYITYIVRWLCNHRNLTIVRWSDICHIDFWGKWRHFGKRIQAKGSTVAHFILYSIYSMIGQSIASISDLSGIFTSALRTSVNMSPQVWYIGYRPPYHTIYITKKKPKLQFQYSKYNSKSYCEHFMCIDNMSGLKCSLTYVLACSTLTNLLSW